MLALNADRPGLEPWLPQWFTLMLGRFPTFSVSPHI